MRGQITVISEQGGFETLDYDGEFSLQKLTSDIQEALHGYMEIVPYWDVYNNVECIVFCNTDGKNIGMPRNNTATALWDKALVAKNLTRFRDGVEVDHLVGPIVIVIGDDAFMRAL
jgi:hypothetical protein